MDASPAPVVYRRRRNALSRAEREWRAERDALVTKGGSGRERRWPWRDVISVRLRHDPARDRPWRYTFQLQFKQGHKVSLDNAHFVSTGVYEDRSAAYTAFALAALDRLHATNPKLRALSGETQKRYFFLALTGLLVMGGAAYALIALPTPFDGMPSGNLIKLGILALMLPVFWILMLRAFPRGAPLDALPAHVLPPRT